MKLELGGGTSTALGFTNLDPLHGEGPFQRRAQDGAFPLADGSVEAARCSHLMEHIPAGAERIFVMNEVHRVLVPGGHFEVIVPLFPGWGAIADPTHVSFWVEQSFWYFTGRWSAELSQDYGIRRWEMASWTTQAQVWGVLGRAVLRKPS
jgi:SAM-dependent methyltransferase